jgi:sugar phosphate permease
LLIVLRFLFGLFQAGAFPAISRLIADWIPLQERGTSQGVLWMACRFGGALAPFLIIALVSWLGSWELALIAVAVLGLVWSVLFWPWFRDRPEAMPQVNVAERELIAKGRAASAGHGQVPWSALLQAPTVWALCLMYGFAGFSANFFITLLPSYLSEHRQIPPEVMRWLTGLPLGFGIAGCLVGGLLSDWIIRHTGNRRWGRRISGLVGHALAGVLFLAINWVTDTWLLGLLLSAVFFCNDLAMGPAWACCADVGEKYAGTVGGMMNTIGNLGGALGALVAGALLGQMFLVLGQPVLGNDLVFAIFAGSFWLASLSWLGVDVTRGLGKVQ